MITWVKNVNNFQIAKVQSQGVISICLLFCQFQPGVAYKSAAYKKKRVIFLSIIKLLILLCKMFLICDLLA